MNQMIFGLDVSSLAQYDHFIGGFCSGVASTAVCHPLDLLKTRFSANEGNPLRPQYTSYWNATRSIFRVEGYRGLYQGFTPNVMGSTISWALYFHWYNEIKTQMSTIVPLKYQNIVNFGSGMAVGTGIMLFTNPIWVSKTRLFLQYETSKSKKYNGMLDCLMKIAHEEGIRGLYKGFLVGIIGSTHGALQITTYDFLKNWIFASKKMKKDSAPNTLETILCSSISKIIATTAIFPYQVLRTRLQDHNVKNSGIIDTTRNALAREGIQGLYKGCLMANIRLLPAAVITFVTYENVRHYVKSLGKNENV